MAHMTDAERIAWIDSASLEDLLRKWRFGRSGDPYFEGAMGEHFAATMKAKREAEGPEAWTRASKNIGWAD
jgi:hypothetical protein